MRREGVVGREAELLVLDDPLVRLVIEGDSGIGKTTLWRYAVERARERGCRVLTCRPGEPESALPFAGLTDLFDGVTDAELRLLPAPQRHALEVAVLRAAPDGALPDPRAVNLAALNLVRLLAVERPVMLAVDDMQWLDPASADVLSYVARRSLDQAVGLLMTVRGESRLELEPDRLRLDGLTPADLHRLVRLRTGLHLAKRDLRRLVEASAGNPSFALELVRSVQRDGWPEPGAPLHATLGDVAERLPPESRDALLVAAALHHPRTAVVRAALGATPGLAEAEDAGVIEIREGRIRFTHPLFASAVYWAAAAERRRTLHARLATVVTEAGERARHLSLSVDGPDAEVAAVIADAAGQARGAMAAELWLMAHHRTPADDPLAYQRAVAAVECLLSAGDVLGARTFLEPVVAEMPPGPHRARALLWLASILFYDEGPREAVATLQRAIPEADRRLTGELHLRIAWFADYDAELRLRSAELLDAQAFSVEYCRFQAGLEADYPALLPDRESSWEADFARSLLDTWAKSFDLPRAREGFEARAHQGGDALVHLVEIECRLGNLDRAARYAEELAEGTGRRRRGQALYATALVAAYRGETGTAVAIATEGRALCESQGDSATAVLHLSVLGFAELSRGDAEAADRHLTRAAAEAAEMGVRFTLFGDQVEAALRLGEVDRAAALVSELDRHAAVYPYPYLHCVAARSHALLALARGDLDEAMAALHAPTGLPMPFERARALLVHGQVLRRCKEKRAAEAALTEAARIFSGLGAKLWEERVAAELKILGLRRGAPDGLTPAQQRVASLVVAGRTNDEVAATLFLSRRTVETHLAHIYRKVGVRSRTQLARVVAAAT